MSGTSREAVLKSIRTATEGLARSGPWLNETWQQLLRSYQRTGTLGRRQRRELMVERLREYGAEVIECDPVEIPQAIAAHLEGSGRHRCVVPVDLPAEWLVSQGVWLADNQLPIDAIERCEGVLTAASGAVAESGTIVLHHGAAEGRRILSLLPDMHIVVLRESQIVETLPEYFSQSVAPPALVTWISGPSATADIEMTRIKGVHGPRFLHVVLVREP